MATERIGLVLPTSMCSAQIARLAASRMNETGLGRAAGIDRFVALAHSEGCGFGGETMYHTLYRTYRGYATHPNVVAALLLEHGCEKIPNDAMRRQFETANLPLDRFGWASVQLDGGIDKSIANVAAWFERAAASLPATTRVSTGFAGFNLGLLSAGSVGGLAARVLGELAAAVLTGGGSVLVPEGDALLADAIFRERVLGPVVPHASLAYGEPLAHPGLHVVATDSDHWVENVTGLGECGAHLFVGLVADTPQQGHPLLPVIQVAQTSHLVAVEAEVDQVLGCEADVERLLELIAATARGDYVPASTAGGFVDFQLARGLLGVST